MIIAMKKIHLIVDEKRIDAALEKLRALGLVHIEHLNELKGHSLSHQYDELNRLDRVILWMEQNSKGVAQIESAEPRSVFHEVSEKLNAIEKLKESTLKREPRIKQWEPWGHFSLEDMQALEEEGVFMKLYEIPVGELSKLPGNVAHEIIYKSNGIARCVIISSQKVDLGFEQVNLPPLSLNEEKAIQEAEVRKLQEYEKEVLEKCKYLNSLKEYRRELQDHLNFSEVRIGMQRESTISILKGYAPVNDIKHIERTAKEEKWGILVEEPSGDDQVPTLIKNPKWIDIIKPVFGVINVLPGYKELDVSLVFLFFFSVFFGILIGDAGYGSVFMALTLFAHIKLKNKVADKSPFILMYVLSACTILWGALTGTFFGTLLLGHAIKPMIGWLTDIKNVQLLCFLIGALHLSIAHLWRLANRFPSFGALAELGWIIVIWGGFFAAAMMILGVTSVKGMDIFTLVKLLMAGGAALVVIDILTQDKKTIFVNLILFIFGCISAFTDVVSYVRLFAVGLASVAVADAFNQMALGFGFTSFVAGLITVLILVVGHIFNMVLCGFGILVHGLRLNVLEFSGHLGLEWAGFRYDPFKKINHVKLQS